MHRMPADPQSFRAFFRSVFVLCLFSVLGFAQVPAGYYDTVDNSNATALRSTLHDVIDDHTRFPYTSSATDTWDILETADEDPGNAGNILDLYRNASYGKEGGGNSFYNREHSWPKSYGFPNDGSTNYPYTDCHHLFLCDSGYNSSRSNKPYRDCNAACSEKVTDSTNGLGGGSGTYPGNSNWTTGSFEAGTWEVWGQRRGDVARALLYMDIRYEGGTHNVTGIGEPDLILTDNEALIGSSNTGSNGTVAYMGMLSVLLQWHAQDPVDANEVLRNDVIFSFQGNRNPFVDHPEWIDCLYGASCSTGGGAPGSPQALMATAGDGFVELDWFDNSEPDLSGYNVHRSTSSGGPFAQINGALSTVSAYTDTTVSNGTTYYYNVTAVNSGAQESAASASASALPEAPGGTGSGVPWINEIHYDNASGDVAEFFEIAGPAGMDLSGWQVLGYNGSNGTVYFTANLSGILPDQGGCIGSLSFTQAGIQNGAPDGLALVDDAGTVIEFLSYEGSIVATDGAASGLTSSDIGVSETGSTPIGDSLQLGGSGSASSDFTWQAAQADTPGQVNTGQTFADGCGGGATPPAMPTGLSATAGDASVSLSWNSNGEADLSGYDVHRSTNSGGAYTRLNGTQLTSPTYVDSNATNGTTYYYVVTAWNTSSMESSYSAESGATPEAPPTGGTGDAWINEFHYDNGSSDIGEFVEVAGAAGLDLTGWQILGYNGSGGGVYSTTALSGTLPDQGSGLGTLSFSITGLQNGSPDGLALVDGLGTTIEFLSYEGTFAATDGAASGMTSTDVGVSESGSGPVGDSLQLGGSGTTRASFSWQTTQADTPGAVNQGQTFGAGGPTPPAAPTGLVATAGDDQVAFTWNANGEADLSGYDILRATVSGGPYSRLNGSQLVGTSYTDVTASNGVTYYYVLTAWNTFSQESPRGVEVSATPQAPPTGWTQLTFDDFDSGWGNFVDGGSDSRLYTGGTHASSGDGAANIQDNSGVSSSFYYANGVDVTSYGQLRVQFTFKAVSMDNSNEDFWLQYYDGSSWQTVASWARGTDFDNNVFYNEEVLIDSSNHSFPTDMKIRFMCDASANRDDVYIDDVSVSGQ